MKEKGFKELSPKRFLGLKGVKADVISYWHVLEHIENPWAYLIAGRRNLSRKGKIIVAVPNIDSLEFRIFGKNWFHLLPEYHIWHFLPTSVRKLLSKTGFSIDKIDYWSPEHQIAGILQSFINYTSGSHNVLHKLVKRGTDEVKVSPRVCFWSVFWLTLGLPIVIVFWVVVSLLRRPGTFVVIASSS